jgi:hypothetical protein
MEKLSSDTLSKLEETEMEDTELVELILQSVAGPAAATVVALLCLAGFAWLMIKHIMPQQNKVMDEFVKEGRANRKVFVDAVEVMSRRLDKVEDSVDSIKEDIKIIRERI